MANPALCFSPIQAEVIRITRLDQCGVPVTGAAGGQAVLDAFTEVQNSPQYEEGQRFLLRKANGEPCVNQKGAGFFNWLEQTVQLCTLDPTVLAIVTGDRLITDGVTGVGVAFGEGLLDEHYSIEAWQPVSGSGACDASGQQQYFYWAFPNLFDAQMQDFTFQNDTFTLGWKGTSQQGSTLWDLGDDWLPPGEGVESGDHYLFAITTEPPPEPYCGTVVVS